MEEGYYGHAIYYYQKQLDLLDDFDVEMTGEDFQAARAEGHNNIGIAYQNIGENEKAMFHFEKSLEILKSASHNKTNIRTTAHRTKEDSRERATKNKKCRKCTRRVCQYFTWCP